MEDLTNTAQIDNGVDVNALLEARNAIEGAPETGQAIWRAQCEWQNGVHSRTTMNGFYVLCDEQARPKSHTIDADHPELFAAEDNGATPVEIVLSGLASCLTAGVASVAQNRGIQLRSVTATVEGEMDLAGILGIESEARNGFRAIRIGFDIDADASAEDIAALVAQSQRRSAVFDIITNPTMVNVSVNAAAEDGS
ncbi:MAG: OsmC family protein [Pseudomonadota bacterium]